MFSLGNSSWPFGVLPPTARNGGKECSLRQGGLPPNLTPSLLVPDGSHKQLGFKKGMAIASLNVNGLRGHLDEAQHLIRNLGIHILALNETKLNPKFPKELTSVAGYQQERLERTCNGGGVSIHIMDSIKYKRHLDIPTDDLELICIEVEPPKTKSFHVLAWYRPPSDPVGSFNKLEKVISFLDKEGKEIILLGDTNCDLTPKQAEQPIDNNVSLNGTLINQATSYEYLGITLDNHLTMSMQIDKIYKRASNRVKLLQRIRPNISPLVAGKVYSVMIRPVLLYCYPIYLFLPNMKMMSSF